MQFINTTTRPFTSEDLFSGTCAGHHTYQAIKKGAEGNILRIDWITVIGDTAVKMVCSTLEAEEGDTCLCAEISFEIDGDYDRSIKGISVRATKWLLSVWKQAQEVYGEFYCDPHDADGHLSYRIKVFSKLGFVDDHGMMVKK